MRPIRAPICLLASLSSSFSRAQVGCRIKLIAVAKVLYDVASRNEKVPLRLPLSTMAVKLITMKFQEQLGNSDTIEDLSTLDLNQVQFNLHWLSNRSSPVVEWI